MTEIKQFNLDFLNNDFFLELESNLDQVDDSISIAKKDQRILLNMLAKNILFTIFEYLETPKILSVAISCNKIAKRVMND